jgi:hypothetical protein
LITADTIRKMRDVDADHHTVQWYSDSEQVTGDITNRLANFGDGVGHFTVIGADIKRMLLVQEKLEKAGFTVTHLGSNTIRVSL